MIPETLLNGRVSLFADDCREAIRHLPDCSIDSCVTDPPYSLVSIVKRFGADSAAPVKSRGASGVYKRAAAGFMGKRWDTGEVAFDCEFWAQVLRVLKPGAHLLAFGGTRTYHRMACAIEDAGFEIRDTIMWVYGSGFPKSHDVSKGIDKAAGAEREVVGRNVSARISVGSDRRNAQQGKRLREYGAETGCNITTPATDAARQWSGYGTALKPAVEPIVLARKPLGTGDINVRRNVENGIRKCGYRGDIIWTERFAENANGQRRKKPALAQKPATSVEIVRGNTTETTASAIEMCSIGQTENGTPNTAKNISIEPSSDIRQSEAKFCSTTGQSADAAERPSQHSSLSTTSAVEAAHTENQLTGESMATSSAEVSHLATESFAGIVTGLTGSAGCVHIKREGSSFVWPKDLPTLVPSKPLNVAANVLKWGTGALNIDGCRVEGVPPSVPQPDFRKVTGRATKLDAYARNGEMSSATGRWPANLIHDGSEEVIAAFPANNPSGSGNKSPRKRADNSVYGSGLGWSPNPDMGGDSGSAARFFYTAKADANDRLGSKHPTVKPLDLMQYLVRLVTPKGGTVLDPFSGTGTTAEAAFREGMNAVLIEREEEYCTDIRRRMALVMSSRRERKHEGLKARNKAVDNGPLFEARSLV